VTFCQTTRRYIPEDKTASPTSCASCDFHGNNGPPWLPTLRDADGYRMSTEAYTASRGLPVDYIAAPVWPCHCHTTVGVSMPSRPRTGHYVGPDSAPTLATGEVRRIHSTFVSRVPRRDKRNRGSAPRIRMTPSGEALVYKCMGPQILSHT
jgi:hypothetical protein